MVDSYDPLKCEYHYDFTLINAGPIWMNVTHLYEDYSSFLELSSPPQSRPKPHMLSRPLLSSAPIRLNLCASTCAPYTPPTLLTAAPAIGLPPPKLASCKNHDSYNATHGGELEGGYVPSPQLDLIHPPLPLPLDQKHSRATTGLYTFVRPHCASLAPHLQHDGLRLRNHTSCLREGGGGGGVRHRALIIGDSHGRAVFDVSVWRVLRGEKGVALSSPKALSKKEERGVGGWDPYLTSGFSCDYLKQFDSITISAGTHTAAWNCPTTSTHVTHLRSILHTWPRLLTQCLSTPPLTPPRSRPPPPSPRASSPL
ncbi:hypothetical protein BCR35DRAFT_329977 [Leucosporidium creatinivorum]|uniref:Uncharacterized protein n=1 Tax=Leucosporidium creatinivorum TaxID=106004 RepID=A0A1Y2FYM7_9BASI|nr:hypothetical protein BCR35DRAFT_329977 [Leucosporidium creatinivorum]